MVEKIICWLVTFGSAVLFYSIGVYAQRREKPMWFWSGTRVEADQITDIKQYNTENGTMWKWYSLWFAAAGLAEIWSSIAMLIFLVLSGTVGLAVLIRSYKKVYKKYSVKQ